MRTRTMIVPVAMLIAAVFACRTEADMYRTVRAGNWSDPMWEIADLSHPGKWMPTSAAPDCGDSAEIRHAVHVEADRAITVLTIDSGASLTINAGQALVLCGTGPCATAVGDLIVEGRLLLDAWAGVPYLEIRGGQKLPSPGGEIRGLVSAEIRLNATAAAARMTNLGVVAGRLRIMGVGSHGAVFENDGVVTADDNGELCLDTSLTSIADISDAAWMVSSRVSVLTFGRGSAGLAGAITMLGNPSGLLPHGGVLNVNNDVLTSGAFTYDYGTITVFLGRTLCATGAHAGACVSSLPFSGNCLGMGFFAPCP